MTLSEKREELFEKYYDHFAKTEKEKELVDALMGWVHKQDREAMLRIKDNMHKKANKGLLLLTDAYDCVDKEMKE